MTHKDFLQDLQKACHSDNQQCTMLLNALCRLMAQAGVEQIPVTLSGLGTFTSHKHPEYIQDDPQSGRQTLYPPRISYRMQIGVADGQQDVVEKQLADHTHCDPSFVHSFLDALVHVILDSLSHGQEVEVKGLGVFRNIITHQGELQRVAYTPDEQMRRLVNAPFDCFEPIVISDVAFSSVPVSAYGDDNSDKIETSVTSVVETIVDSDSEEVEGSGLTGKNETFEPVIQESPEIESETEAETALVINVETIPVKEAEVVTAGQVDDVTENIGTGVDSLTESRSVTDVMSYESSNRLSDVVIHDSGEPRHGLSLWTLLFLLLVLISAGVIWFVRSVRVENDSHLPIPPELSAQFDTLCNEIDTVMCAYDSLFACNADSFLVNNSDTLAVLRDSVMPISDLFTADENPVVASASESKQSIVTKQEVKNVAAEPNHTSSSLESSTEHYLKNPDGIIQTHKLQPGERLTLVALQYYGDKAFWPYVYEVNRDKIKTPNVVPAGIVLRLPDPTYYGIDATNPQSVRDAKLKASALNKQ